MSDDFFSRKALLSEANAVKSAKQTNFGATGGAFLGINRGASIVLSPAEAEEYCVFKRQKRVEEALAALTKTVIFPKDDLSAAALKKCAEEAKLCRSSAVRVPANKAAFSCGLLSGKAAVDCVVGGDGETTAKVKKYEAKKAIGDGASQITLTLAASAVKAEKWGEVKKEIKKVRRAVKKRRLTVRLPSTFEKNCGAEVWGKLAAIAADCGANCLSVPFVACTSELTNRAKDGCFLEATGVETASDFKTAIVAGVSSVVCTNTAHIRADLLEEAENAAFAVPAAETDFFTGVDGNAEKKAAVAGKTAGEGEKEKRAAEKTAGKEKDALLV